MAQYLVLIYDDESTIAGLEQADFEKLLKEHQMFGEKHGKSLRGGNALQPSSSATSIRKDRSGGATVTDGPFAETKEALGGYYVIEASDLDEAVAIAKEVPAITGVEVRPVRVFD